MVFVCIVRAVFPFSDEALRSHRPRCGMLSPPRRATAVDSRHENQDSFCLQVLVPAVLAAVAYNGTHGTYMMNGSHFYNMDFPAEEVCQPAFNWIAQNKLVQCFDSSGKASTLKRSYRLTVGLAR